MASLSSEKTDHSIEAVIFDLDGLLIDSEKIYTEASNRVLARYGKKMNWDVKQKLQGRPGNEATAILIRDMELPLTVDECQTEMKLHHEDLFTEVQPLPGAMKLVEHLYAHKIPIAIATGSHERNIHLKTDHLPDLMMCFPSDKIMSTDHLIKAGRPGKPAPDIYQMTAEALGIPEERSSRILVFEDGMPGVEAAKNASMKVVWIPDPDLRAYRKATRTGADENDLGATELLNSLLEFEPQKYGLPPYPASSIAGTMYL